jgi:hypothetical protein
MKIITATLLRPGQRLVIAGTALRIIAVSAHWGGITLKMAQGTRLMYHDERCVIAQGAHTRDSTPMRVPVSPSQAEIEARTGRW